MAVVRPTGLYLLDFFCSHIQFYIVLSSYLFMPPTLEKLKGHIALGSSFENLLRYSFEISYMDSAYKIVDTHFFKSGLSPFVKFCPF